MSPPSPTILDKRAPKSNNPAPVGWDGTKFPLSRLDLNKIGHFHPRKTRRSLSSMQNSVMALKASAQILQNVAKSPRRNLERQRGVVSGVRSPCVSRRISPRITSAGNVRVISRTDSGWSWLSVKFKEMRANKSFKPRKGELPAELIEAIWGSHNLRHCQLSNESLRGFNRKRVSIDPELEIKKIRAKRLDRDGQVKSANSLMDILLRNWSYFEHSHSTLGKMEKDVHAKYCEDEFGHFLLSNGQQIHGQFNVNLHVLIRDLRKLMTKLRSQIMPTAYQEIPAWKSPRLEEDPKLEIPPMPPMPQLYPIVGLKAVPSEQEANIPNDYPAPVFKSPIPKEHPALVLPEPLKFPPLKLPIMSALAEDGSTIDYDAYREEPIPIFVLPQQEPLPVWEKPQVTELPPEPEFAVPQVITPPVLETMPPFRAPLLDPRPCERSYYDLGKDERGVCDGLCSKHGHKRHFVLGQHRREPCFAKPPPLLSIPIPPFPEAEAVLSTSELQGIDISHIPNNVQVIPYPIFKPPPEEPAPLFETPKLKEEPIYVAPPPVYLPSWKEPKAPPPVGWMAGQRPVLLIDCSGGMAGERFEAVKKSLRTLFGSGGQAEIAITHFDIIVYSFDAWSFGDIENSYSYKQSAASRYMRSLEPMRVKCPETFEAALNWVSRWRPTGPANLSKAIELACSRASADCIYLFTEGKSDKPVLIVESLRRQAQIQGYSIPIYTVGMRSSKLRCRFLKRLSAVTGGQFVEFDFKYDQQKAFEGKDEDLADILWERQMVEDIQRKNAELGRKDNIQEIIKCVETQYPSARQAMHLEAHKQKVMEVDALYQAELEKVRTENAEAQQCATEAYEKLVKETQERNRASLEGAKAQWEQEVETVRKQNKQMVEDALKWRDEVAKIRLINEKTQTEARLRFGKDLNEVEERNAATIEKAKEEHIVELERIQKKHTEALEDVARRQKEIDEKVATINKATQEDYKATCRAIQESNAMILAQAHKLHEERLESIKSQNAKAIVDGQKDFEERYHQVRMSNGRKKVALTQHLESIKRRKEEAIAAHKVDVTHAIALHEERVKAYNKMNSENEKKARKAWKQVCEEIDKQNMSAVRATMEEFEAEQLRVQEENVKLAERRLELKRCIAEIGRENGEVVKRKKVEWKEACAMVEKQYEEEVAKAKEAHKNMVEQVKMRNAEKLQSSLLEHRAKVAAVQSYNETVRPYVEASNAVRMEVKRIEAFLQCIADTILPQDRHIREKNMTKSTLDKDLDVLAVSDAMLNTEMLIEALRRAYRKTEKRDRKLSQRVSVVSGIFGDKSRFSGLIPIHPARAIPHSCLEPEDLNK